MSRARPPRSEGGAPKRLVDGGAEGAEERAVAALLARVPEVQPDDLAVERVWRRVVSPPESRRRAWGPAWRSIPVAISAALVATLLLVLARPATPQAEVMISSGGVYATRATEEWHRTAIGEALVEAERIRTDGSGRAMVSVRGVAAVWLTAETDVGLERVGRGTFLRLSRGSLTARVEKRAPGEAFVVQTDRYTVKVVGTLFTVEEGPSDHLSVSVREGVVEVSDNVSAATVRVTAGSRWSSDAPTAVQPDRTPDEMKTLLEAGLARRSFTEIRHAFEALPARSPEATSPTVAATTPPASAPPVEADAPLPARSPALAERRAPSLPPRAAAVVPSSEPLAQASPPGTAEASAEPGPSAAPPPATKPAESAFAKGIALEARGDFEGAARELTSAMESDPGHGDLALYTLARLTQRRLHDPKRALILYRRYREQYPQGSLLPEVDLAIVELELEVHDPGQALSDTTRFLSLHPASERADQVRLLRANLLRDADRCREALADYAAVRSGNLADDALYSTAYCQRHLGDRASAAVTLEEYLRRFPSGVHRAEAEKALRSAAEIDKSF